MFIYSFFLHSSAIFEEVRYTRYYVYIDTHILIHLNIDLIISLGIHVCLYVFV